MTESVRLSWDKREKQFYKGLEEYYFKEEEVVEKSKYYCENEYCFGRTEGGNCKLVAAYLVKRCMARHRYIKDTMPTEEEYEEGNLTKEIV